MVFPTFSGRSNMRATMESQRSNRFPHITKSFYSALQKFSYSSKMDKLGVF